MKKNVSMQPETYRGLLDLGKGSLSPGIELAYQLAKKALKKGK